MVDKKSQQHVIWFLLLFASIVFNILSALWSDFLYCGYALAEESTKKTKVLSKLHLPDDLIEVTDAQCAPLDGLAHGSQEAQERQRQAVQQLGLPLEVRTQKTGILFRLIPAGYFTMGSPGPESYKSFQIEGGPKLEFFGDEKPHKVSLTKEFYCGKFEVTQAQWNAVMGSNPSKFKNAGKNAPVEQVSWEDCHLFLKKLCQMEGVPEGTYRLLTEAEWEYACRAGTETALYTGQIEILGQNNAPAVDPVAWYAGNSGVSYQGAVDSSGWKEKQYKHSFAGTHIVGKKKANAFGVYDMIGNVCEWCQDWYGEYLSDEVVDPAGPRSGTERVRKGSSWHFRPDSCRSAYRNRDLPGNRRDILGLRISRIIPSNS